MKYKSSKLQSVLLVNHLSIFENSMVTETSIAIKPKRHFEFCIFTYNTFCIFTSQWFTIQSAPLQL